MWVPLRVPLRVPVKIFQYTFKFVTVSLFLHFGDKRISLRFLAGGFGFWLFRVGLRISGSRVLAGPAGLKTSLFWKEGLRAMMYIWKHTP